MQNNDIVIRQGTPKEAHACGRIIYQAFGDIAARHRFPTDFPSIDDGIRVASRLLAHPGFYGVVAERGGEIVGSNFLDERSPIAGLGPITVDPSLQDSRVGRGLMQAVLDRVAARQFPVVRLIQDAYNSKSFALYIRLGFQSRGTVALLQGPVIRWQIPGYNLRPAEEKDLEQCNSLCFQVHGHHRNGELLDSIKQEAALVVERNGLITGYTSGVGFRGHSVAETNDDLKVLIGGVSDYSGSGFLVPTDNGQLLQWCFENGLRMVKSMTLMTIGLYSLPRGAWLPSILY